VEPAQHCFPLDFGNSGTGVAYLDVLMILGRKDAKRYLTGLAKEAGLAPLEMLRSQRSFLGALRFNTEWACKQFPPDLIAAKIKEVEALVRLLDERRRDRPRWSANRQRLSRG
jgi:hypothetical protein